MNFDNVRDWQGTAKDLLQELERKSDQLQLSVASPRVRTVRAWRSKGIFSHSKGENFKFRQILEGLETLLLLKKGWTLNAIAEILPSFDDLQLERKILEESSVTEAIASSETQSFFASQNDNHLNDLAHKAVILLAQGILQQYTRILNESEIVRQDDRSIPKELYQAMYSLGRLYIEEEKCDRAACIHDLLERSRYTLNFHQWDLDVFKQSNFKFREILLIEPDLRVPTSECSDIARNSGGFGEDNVIEHRLYTQLKESTERLGGKRKHLAYTAVRELLGRRSLIGERELIEYLIEHQLTALQGMIINNFFTEVPEIWLIQGLAHRCAYCETLMRPHHRFPDTGYCPIRLCEGNSEPMVLEKLDPQQERLLIAKPQILTYWTSPAIDEINIFDRAKEYGLDVQLYPESDLCDVSINNYAIGIDAKSYNSPVSLAMRLNRDIGGLIHYRQRIIAVSDRIVANTDGYLDILRSSLDNKGDPARLEIKSVSEVFDLLKEVNDAS